MIDVDAILADLPDGLDELGDDPWGGASLAICGDADCRCAATREGDQE